MVLKGWLRALVARVSYLFSNTVTVLWSSRTIFSNTLTPTWASPASSPRLETCAREDSDLKIRWHTWPCVPRRSYCGVE